MHNYLKTKLCVTLQNVKLFSFEYTQQACYAFTDNHFINICISLKINFGESFRGRRERERGRERERKRINYECPDGSIIMMIMWW